MRLAILAVLAAGLVVVFAENSIENDIANEFEQADEDDVGARGCRRINIPSTVGCCYARTYKYLLFVKLRFFSCISMRALPYHNTARLVYALNHRHVYDHTISLKSRKIRVCSRIPRFPRHLTASRICLYVTNLNYRKRLVCARIYGYFKLPFKTYHVHHSWGCFKLPPPTEYNNEVDTDAGETKRLEPDLTPVDEFDKNSYDDLGLEDIDLDPEFLSAEEAQENEFMFDEN